MLIILGKDTILNIKTLKSMLITLDPIKEESTVSSLFGLFPKTKTVSHDNWKLVIEYVNEVDDKHYEYSSTCRTRKVLEDIAASLINQLKQYDATLVNQAFEDAFLKG